MVKKAKGGSGVGLDPSIFHFTSCGWQILKSEAISNQILFFFFIIQNTVTRPQYVRGAMNIRRP